MDDGVLRGQEPAWWDALLSTDTGEADPDVSYSARDCRCGAAMRRSRLGPFRWYCDQCGRHERH